MLIPRQTVPDLQIETLTHGRFQLSAETAPNGTLIVFYRGLHCPICITYLKELDAAVPAAQENGFSILALSSDNRDLTEIMAKEVGVKHLRLGHGLPLQTARDWGLYLSTSRGPKPEGYQDPPLFSEPGAFLIKPDQTLYFASIQTMPQARPPVDQLIRAMQFMVDKGFPARGEYTGPV